MSQNNPNNKRAHPQDEEDDDESQFTSQVPQPTPSSSAFPLLSDAQGLFTEQDVREDDIVQDPMLEDEDDLNVEDQLLKEERKYFALDDDVLDDEEGDEGEDLFGDGFER